ncbi:MAG: endolytic transglycosylase MltG [Actinomycetota bacterium]|nr:endolytic transglycosylase MltG [Actinomycetota bacterium]
MSLTRRGKVITFLVVILMLLGGAAIAGTLYLTSIGVFGGSDPGKVVEVKIPKGATTPEVAEILEEEGIIESALGLRIAIKLDGTSPTIEAGRYELAQGLSARDALKALAEGAEGPEYITVTFPEGSWLTDMAATLSAETHIDGDEFLDLVTTGKVTSSLAPEGTQTLEGLLFPSTYQLIKSDTARKVAERLVRHMEKEAGSLDFAAKMDALGYTPYEGMIVASMIEGEARIDEERPMVARVIYNRLIQGMTLGIDATIQYAIREHKEALTESDLAIDSPYNTRLVAGLPPTPIGAPGAAALKAAAEPADGNWLYYVLADCEGHHAFSESYDEFLDNKRAYQALDC